MTPGLATLGALARSIGADAEAALRGTLLARPWWAGPRLVLVTAPVIGLATGSFSVDEPSRAVLMLYAAIKMPLLVLATGVLCLPGFYVLHVAFGVRRDFPTALRGVLAGQGVFSLTLASMAPLIPVWYSLVHARPAAVLGDAALFALAALTSLRGVRRVYRTELGGRRVHLALLACWFGLYGLVGVQMGWMLRPFVGSPDLPPAFLRDDVLTNGYVVVWRMVVGGA